MRYWKQYIQAPLTRLSPAPCGFHATFLGALSLLSWILELIAHTVAEYVSVWLFTLKTLLPKSHRNFACASTTS